MELLKNHLELCSKTYEDGINYRSFGSTIINKCNIDLSGYITRNYTMYFYELFLLDPTTNKFIDIPILIDNVPNAKSLSGGLNSALNQIDWIITRRFFLVDNLSALQYSGDFSKGTGTPYAIRFAKTIKLIVLLQNTDGAKIMVPYLEILYKAKTISLINEIPSTTVDFTSEYRMTITGFKNAANGIFIALNIIIAIIVGVRMYIWYKLNPPTLSPVYS